MKKSLLFFGTGILFVCLIPCPLAAQETIFSEDFSGFTAGTHEVPSTSDVSGSLDTKTSIPGWAGSKIYPALGEIKIGTLTLIGWIETPLINLSDPGSEFIIRFDLARWPNDATTVQVYLNNLEKGPVLTPGDVFQTVQINCTDSPGSGKIMIKGLTKRFFIDNFSVISGNLTTNTREPVIENDKIRIYPVPASDEIVVTGLTDCIELEIFDLSGRMNRKICTESRNEVRINVTALQDGIYFLRGKNGNLSFNKRFVRIH